MNERRLSIEIEELKSDIEEMKSEQRISDRRIGYCLRKLSKLEQKRKQKSRKEDVA